MLPASESKLFEPIQVGNIRLNHRVFLPPLTRYRNDDDHVPLPIMKKHYADRASVPGTLLIAEGTAVAHGEEGLPNNPGFVNEAQVDAWKSIIDAVHANGSFYFQQLYAMGRASDPKHLNERGYDYRGASSISVDDQTMAPRAMTEEEILGLIDDFAAAAKRAIAAGADGVEIHSAHGYLLDQFLSAAINNRTDQWGGLIENRARMTLAVVKRVSEAVGSDRVALRLSPYASYLGASKDDIHEPYSYLITELKKVGLAYLSLTESYGDPMVLFFNQEGPNYGKTLDFILEQWDNQSPVLIAGGYSPETAVWAVEEHYAKWDVLIGFGRHFLANPDLVYRIQHGIALNDYHREWFYTGKLKEGYNDYPFSEQYLQEASRKDPPTASRL